jgi:hypothetical protein
MTIMEKVETYGYYFMDLATDEEVEQYWELVDGSPEYQAKLLREAEEILCCEY